jgi:hypothetical protein
MPKSTFPAAGTGLPVSGPVSPSADLSRRMILSTVPAAAIGIGALAVPAFAAASNEDAALLAREPELVALRNRYRAALDAYGDAETASFAERPDAPSFDQQRYLKLNRLQQRAYFDEWPRRVRDHKEEIDRLAAKYKLPHLEEVKNELEDQMQDYLADMVETKAVTLAGVQFKARWAGLEDDDELRNSALADLLDLEI